MTYFAECIGTVAPFYNMVLVVVVLILFYKLLKIEKKKGYIIPWKILLFAICVYILEELNTVLNILGVISTPRIIHVFLEMIIITSFIYMLLLQKEFVGK